jgi:hypothetical protein
LHKPHKASCSAGLVYLLIGNFLKALLYEPALLDYLQHFFAIELLLTFGLFKVFFICRLPF